MREGYHVPETTTGQALRGLSHCSRAEQVSVTAIKFSKDQLEGGLKMIFETDRDLRSARPDDRTVVENFVVRLCG